MKIREIKKQKNVLGRFLFLTLLTLLFNLAAHAQVGVIQGKVVGDEDGLPVPGVSIVVKGAVKGTATDFDGKFSIKAKEGDLLIFTYVGMRTVNVKAGKGMTVKMKSVAQDLTEVVVIGYGTVKKKELTGAVASLKASDIESVITSDLGNALQGQISGVTVIASGEPGGASEIQIRGVSSLSGSNSPLYVVDGIAQEGDPGIAPSEVESLDVLKDAASTAVYGVRGAAGVILITTKKGKAGVMAVNLNISRGYDFIGEGTPLLNTRDQTYVDIIRQRNISPSSLDSSINLATLGNRDNFQRDTNLADVIFNDFGEVQNSILSISGGSNELKYSFNTGFYDNKGIVLGNNFNRFNLRTNATYKKNRMSFNIGVGLLKENRDRGAGGMVSQIVRYRPTFAIASPSSTTFEVDNVAGDSTVFTGLLDAITATNNTKNNRAFANFTFGYELSKKLNFTTNIGLNDYTSNSINFRPSRTTINTSSIESPQVFFTDGILLESYLSRNSINWDAALTYKTTIANNHNFTFTGVMSREEYNGKEIVARKEGVNNDKPVFNSATGVASVGSGTDYKHILQGFLARFQYDYKGKYLLTSSIRRDGSSRFAPQNRWGLFPSTSVAWNISDEGFFKPLSNTINNLKFRVSSGTVGNENFDDYLFGTNLYSGIDYSYSGNVISSGVIQNSFSNADIKWETSRQTNIGFDLGMFKNKLTVSAEYYQTDKKDMLFNVTLPNSAGLNDTSSGGSFATRNFNNLNTVYLNIGNMTNSGYELAIRYRDHIGKLKYRLNGTFTTNENKITKVLLDNSKPIPTPDNGIVSGVNGSPLTKITNFALGHEAGAFYLFETDGIIRNIDELNAYKLVFPTTSAQIGDLRYKDADGNKILDQNDKVYKGSGLSKYQIGFNLNLDYKNWDFATIWYAALGHEIMNGARATSFYYGRNQELLNSYSAVNPDAPLPALRNTTLDNFPVVSDLFLEDGSYLRLKNITLGYKLPNKFANKIGIKRFRIYATAQNILTFTKYSGFDPEVGGNVFAKGLDKGQYPLAKSYLLGLNINF